MTEHEERRVREAFDQLRHDAGKVDTMAAMHRVQKVSRPNPGRTVVLAAVVFVAVVVGGLLFGGRDDKSTVIADDPDVLAPPDGIDGTDGSPSDGLVGTSWVLSAGEGPDGAIPLVDGWPITITFDTDTDSFGGTAACNRYGGSFSTDGSALSLRDLSWTEMGCEGPAMASESAFLSAILLVDKFELADGLLLTGPGVELIFVSEAPVPTADLVGQAWLLDTLIQGDAESSVQGDPALLLLNADGSVSGGTGCRTFTGSYLVSGGSVLFPGFAMQGECEAQLSEQDNLVVTVLGDGFTPTIDGERLTLTSAGNEGLSYKAITNDEVEPLGRPDDVLPDALSAADLRDNLVLDEVTVQAFLVNTGGGWYLCDEVDEAVFTRCTGAWIPVVHVDQDILDQFGPNESSDDIGTWRQSEEPVLLGGRVLEDGRFEVDGSTVSSAPTDDDKALVSRFLELDQRRPDVLSLPLSPEGVLMSLGSVIERVHTAEELADPNNWGFESEGFRGRTGTFSALAVLANTDETEIIAGTHNHCASPPAAVPETLRDARRLSIQPIGIDSCIDWWTVGLYLDESGDVTGIVFDTWEP